MMRASFLPRSSLLFLAAALLAVAVVIGLDSGEPAPAMAQETPSSTDRAVLVALYNATIGPSWQGNTNWLSDRPINEWHGVTADANGRVVELRLRYNSLKGQMPPELGNLSKLTYLDLGGNSLTGKIPADLGDLSELQGLILHDNQLTGSIPPELGNLSELTGLHLHRNQLTGSILPELGNLSKLTSLLLDDNQLTSSIPPELGNLSELTDLDVGGNQLTGSIPPELGNLSELTYLDVGGNQLTGSIPPELGDLSELSGLHLSVNQLTGTIPSELGKLSKLRWLYLSANQLTGTIPSELGKLSKLRELLLNYNQLTGSIPPELGKLPDLQHLYLSGNQLSGTIPSELGKLSKLRRLYLSDNQLTGSIPPELGDLFELLHLILNDNQLTGSIPVELGNLFILKYLVLNDNRLTGSIPPQLGGEFLGLTHLYLYDNQLSGSIPAELGKLPDLQYLYLHDNQLSGCAPASLKGLPRVNIGDLYWCANQAPTLAASIADVTDLTVGDYHQVSLTGVFRDADSDALTVTAASSDEEIATVSVGSDGSSLTVTARARGTTTITVTASDGKGGTVADEFAITVVDAIIVSESGTHVVSLSGVFRDALTLTAASSDQGIATVSVSADYSTLTVTAKSRGTATVTVTGTDGNGETVANEFTIKVKASPVVAAAISNVTGLTVGDNLEVSLTGVFSDADTDKLTLRASSSNVDVVAPFIHFPATNTLTLIANSEGAATITVTAQDSDGNRVSDTFNVMVIAAKPNQSPMVSAAISDAIIVKESGARHVSLSGVFGDADGDDLTVTASSSDEKVATVSVAFDYVASVYHTLTVTAKGRGTATITVSASDGNGGSVSDSFAVKVKAAPTVASAINDISGLEADDSRTVSLSGVFSDSDGDAVTVTNVASSDSAVVAVSTALDPATSAITGLTVLAKSEGTATVTVTAQDADGNTVQDAFDVTVNKANNPPTVANAIADVTIVNESGTHQVALSSVFSDGDGDGLTITANSSNQSVATVSVSADHSTLTVTAKGRGTAIIGVNAADGKGGEVWGLFTVKVKAAPTVASTIADVSELEVDATHEVSMSGVFSDADGDAVTITAAASDEAIATVLVAADYSKLTVTGVAEGTATVTVAARDSDGNQVSDSFTVTVTAPANNAPTVASAIDDATIVNETGAHQVTLTGVFSDADNDTLRIRAKSSDTDAATVSVADDFSALTVTSKARGSATITVTASDGYGGSVSDTFTVKVKAAPVVATAIPDATMVEVSSQEVDLSKVFSDADGDTLTYTVSSTDLDAVAVFEFHSAMQVFAIEKGKETVTVTAQDSDGNQVSDSFAVTVTAPANNPPTVASAIDDATIVNETGAHRVSLSSVFSDADGDALTITASSSADGVATVSVAADQSALTVAAQARGTAMITVSASDGNGGSVSDTFTVKVKTAPVVAAAIDDVSELEVDAMHEVSLSGVFSDADGDTVTVTQASSSDTSIAAVSAAIDGATAAITAITVIANSEGTATITVTARDADGNTLQDAFDVTVNAPASQQQKVNNPPTVSSAIADATIVSESGTRQVSLSGVFHDADSDALTVTASSSDENTATVSVSADHSTLTVTAQARGTATITVTAADGYGGSVEDGFTVRVKAAPVVALAISDVSGLEVGATRDVSLSGMFSDADGDSLTVTASSSDNAKATVSVAADQSALTVSGVAEGTATITVTAQDADGNGVSDAFQVEVVQAPEPEPEPVELPGPVLGLELTTTHDSVSVSWSAPESGDAPDGYIVNIKRQGGGDGETRRPGAGKTALTFRDLNGGSTYEVWVRAQNEAGKGERVKASITLPSVLPGPVTGLEVAATGDGVTVSWSAPDTGGAPDGYIVHIRPEGGAEGSGRTKTPKAKKTKVSFDNLEAGRTYQVWVRAENEAGKGERVHATVTLPEAEPEQQDQGEQGDGQEQEGQSGQ